MSLAPAGKSAIGTEASRRTLALNVAEAASLLGVSRSRVYELVQRGEIPSVRLGQRVVVFRVAVYSAADRPARLRARR